VADSSEITNNLFLIEKRKVKGRRDMCFRDRPGIPNKLYGIEREREMQKRNVVER
jgi:hypothetical protein